MPTYQEKLKDPRWQKKRLEILERDGWKCRTCGDTETTLNVHHCYYEPNANPWDYEDSSLVTLCESCHESEKEAMNDSLAYFKHVCETRGYLSDDIWALADVLGLISNNIEPQVFIGVLRDTCFKQKRGMFVFWKALTEAYSKVPVDRRCSRWQGIKNETTGQE